MNVIKVELEIITPMFSCGTEKDSPEFRLTELKSLMRTTFREVYKFDNSDDMKEKEGALFGSLSNKSPIIFKSAELINPKITDKYLCFHRKDRGILKCIDKGTKVNVELLVKDIKDINIYVDILLLSSILGGLGKRTRKGLGSFKVNKITVNNNKEYSDLLNCSIEETLKKIMQHSFGYELRAYSYDEEKLVFSEIDSSMKYPFLKNIQVYKIGKEEYDGYLFKVSKLTHERLSNKDFWNYKHLVTEFSKDILGNFMNKYLMANEVKSISRFASPIFVTCWEKSEKERYIIVKELNYEYILGTLYRKYKKIMLKSNARNIVKESDFNNNSIEYVEVYIEKLKWILGIKGGKH